MKFENAEYLKLEEKKQIIDFVNNTCKEYDVSTQDIIGLQMSTRMQTTSGQIHFFIKKNFIEEYGIPYLSKRASQIPNNIKDVTLKFSLRLYKTYGFETLMGTVAHELAHYIVLQKKGEKGHTYSFKKICAAIGGHMNLGMAGDEFKNAATTQYCTKKNKWRYTCDCRSRETYRKYSPRTLDRFYCKTCGMLRRDMKLERI